jgi:hypothetical protein
MILLRLYLSEACFHYCRWLDWHGMRTTRKGLALIRTAEVIRRRERIYLGIDRPAPGSSRPPSVPAARG